MRTFSPPFRSALCDACYQRDARREGLRTGSPPFKGRGWGWGLYLPDNE